VPAPASASPRPWAEPRSDEVVRVVRSAGGGFSRRRYDLLGRLRLEERPDGSWLRYRYDETGRPLGVEHSSGERVEYEVSDDGRVWRARTERTETTIRIDGQGFPAEVETAVDGRKLVVAYRRDSLGRVEACRAPGSDQWLRFEREEGRLAVRGGERTYCTVEDGETGTSAVFANGVRVGETIETERRPRFERVVLQDGAGGTVFDVSLAYGPDDRVCDAGSRAMSYDEQGRLTSWRDLVLGYDDEGRLRRRGGARLSYGEGPAATGAATDGGQLAFDVDVLGRRVARHGPDETTRYSYDLFDRLVGVDLPDGGTIRYVYDGFGRLVAREHDGRAEYYAVGIDGHRLARVDADGTVTDSYLWLGEQCVGRLAGPIGAPLEETFHRADAAALGAVGSAEGTVDLVAGADPFGSDRPVEDGRPGYAGLFGDPLTGYLHAGARWLDPLTAQFLTPDSWYCEDVASRVPPALAPLVALLPGGALRITDPVAAYAWCGYDPVNRWDPGGHNWLGLIFTTISALLWEMQLTSLALQMEALSIVIWLLLGLPRLGFLIADKENDFTRFFDDFAITNIAAPVASSRLMVPFAFLLNGVLRVRRDRAWTLGSVIWVSGSRLEKLEETSKRDLLVCANASSYLSAIEDVTTTNTFRVRNPNTLRKGTVSNVGVPKAQITGIAPATTDVFSTAIDFVAVKVAGAAGGDEVRRVDSVVSATELRLDAPPLPKDVFDGKAVEIRRLDPATVRATGGGKTLAREVTFIRGTAIHFKGQTPEKYLPNEGLAVTEFLPAEKPQRRTGVALPAEFVLVHLASPADRTDYAAGNFVRLLSLGTNFARRITATPGDADLVVDASLPAGDHTDVEVARLDRVGAVATAQTAAGDRVRALRLVDLSPRDGVAIESTPPGAVPELRIVLELLLDCTVAALPVDLHTVPVEVDLLVVGATPFNGTVTSSTQITLAAGTPPFGEKDAVRVTKSGPTLHAFDVADSIVGTTLTLKEALPAAFTAGTAVKLRKLEPPAGATPFAADQVVAPGDHVFVHVTTGKALAQGDLIRVRPAVAANGGAARAIAAAPIVVARVDSAVPATLTTNLRVQRLAPNDTRTGATAPEVRQRLTVPGATNPYAANDVLSIVGSERTVAQAAAVDGQNVILTEPIVGLALDPTVTTLVLTATGIASTDGKLDEGLVLIPSDPDEPPLTRREAVEDHEMRHVFQGAVWGPFLVSLPIPWLVSLGFTFKGSDVSRSKVWRELLRAGSISGGITSAFAAGVWGIGSRNSPTELEGEIANNARTLVRFPQLTDESKVAKFSEGSRIEVRKGDTDTFNAVEKRSDRDVTLRFPLEAGKFASGDLVKLSVSPYERIRKIVSIAFGNFEQLWSDHIPSAWGRALSRLLNTDSWLPFLGIYFLGYYVAGGDEKRLWNEQDAAYHSGDLYTNIAVARDRRVFVGQFARIFAFVETRGADDIRFGVSELGALGLLEVQLPTGVSAADVAGGVPSGTDRVRFREHYYIPLHEKVENAVGAFFSTSLPGEYTVRATDELAESVVFTFAFAVSFVEQRRIQVDDIGVTPAGTDVFETEVVPFTIEPRDTSAEYRLRFPVGTTGFGKVDGLRYTAPVLGAGVGPTEKLEITATYGEDHPVFRGSGQVGTVRLTLEERTNLCKKLELTVQEIAKPALAAMKAGETQDFTMPVAPVSATVRPLPAGATGTANVIVRPGRPATLTFVAPAAVTAAITATIDMVFGSDPTIRKPVTATVQITP
jgi:YD repeat-containing protein